MKTKNDLDLYIKNTLKNKYLSCERRDYHKIESKDPSRFKGYSKMYGISFYIDVNEDDLYIDIKILEDRVSMVFRCDDHKLISLSRKIDSKLKEYITSFLNLTDEYQRLMLRYSEFNNGSIPTDLVRKRKIDELIQ